MPGEPARPTSPEAPRHRDGILRLALVALAVAPFLASNPGRVSADSRQYLYLEPGSFLGRATSMWDATFAAGTVPHQHLGFLWPMGPWFWAADVAGLPVWVSQRLWLAAVAAAAGWGMLSLARRTGLSVAPAFVAALAYQLTPYQLAFTARFSVLLLPWAALPWLVLLARRSIEERSWRAPAVFGLIAATAGAANASSLILVLLAPAIVLAAAFVLGERGAAATAALRISVVTVGASAWWISGLLVQGRYGLPILQLTENVETVSAASSADDIVRGLGNWIFTSTDGATTAIDQAASYEESVAVRLATTALPAAAVAVLAWVRFRGRRVVAAMLFLATVVGVGAAPLSGPSVYGRLWRRFSEDSSVGLALRNTPRVVPVLVLATAYTLAVGLEQLRGRARVVGVGVGAAVVFLAIAPVAMHGFLSDDFDRPERIPDHWLALADDLDAEPVRSRVLELPGSNFAVYDWGNTVEPVLTGLIDRPTLAREVLPAGGAGTTDLLAALDRRVQLGTLDPRALAPVARLLGVGDIVVRGDLDADRFGLADPEILVREFATDPPPGTTVTGRYGGTAGRPLLLRLTVDDPAPRLRAVGHAPTLFAGNGDGIVDAAAAGLVDGRGVVLPSTTTDRAAELDAIERGAALVVTDTNRRRPTTFFYTISDDVGATEAQEHRSPDPTGYDVRFGPFATAPPGEQTVAIQLGGTVRATLDGGPERPEDRAVHAFDGDPTTAWRPRFDPVGQRIEARFDRPVDADVVTVRTTGGSARITSVSITVDGTSHQVRLDGRAETTSGQPVPVPGGDVSDVAVEITGVDGTGQVGVVDVLVGRATVDEVLRMPLALLERTAGGLGANPIHYVLTRDRGDARDPSRAPTDSDIDRILEVAERSAFQVRGTITRDGDTPVTGCRDDVVTLDGSALAVRLDGTELTSCAPVVLERGPHRITTSVGGPVQVDQLVLSRDEPARTAPPVDLEITSTAMRQVTGTVATASSPFWLVLSESRNDGWELSVENGRVVSSTMADGYANGWLVAPDGSGPVVADLRWTPQRVVWVGMALSALTVLACAAVLVRGRRDAVAVVALETRTRPIGGGPIGRAVIVAALTLGLWFVAGIGVAVLTGLAAGIRSRVAGTTLRIVRVGIACLAAGCVFTAEFTDRPSLVFLALGLVLADVIATDRDGGQEVGTTVTSAPG